MRKVSTAQASCERGGVLLEGAGSRHDSAELFAERYLARLPTTPLEGGEASKGAGMAKSGARVGIDLEQSSIAGAQVKGVGQGYSLTHVSVRALPEGLVFEGEVVDVDGLAAELKTFWKESGFTAVSYTHLRAHETRHDL